MGRLWTWSSEDKSIVSRVSWGRRLGAGTWEVVRESLCWSGLSSGPLWSALHTASLLLGLPASSTLLRSFCQEKSSPDLPLTLSSPAQTLCGFRLPQDIQALTSWTDLCIAHTIWFIHFFTQYVLNMYVYQILL